MGRPQADIIRTPLRGLSKDVVRASIGCPKISFYFFIDNIDSADLSELTAILPNIWYACCASLLVVYGSIKVKKLNIACDP